MRPITLLIALGYLLAAAAALGFIHAPRRVSPRLARLLMVGTFCAHTVYLIVEVVRHGNIPINNVSETLFVFLWFTVVFREFRVEAHNILLRLHLRSRS